ncbi:MAG: hypothetical protein EPO68_08235 [Planctomycetota bacterium]|nr:MAG: hypothetical protein EPO68_08235 [Planctomycetota bacterium]
MKFALLPAAFLPLTLAGVFAWFAPRAEDPQRPAPRVGTGAHTYDWQRGWFKLPAGVELGNTHGNIAFDAAGRVYVNSDNDSAVMLFGPDGNFVGSLGKELGGGAHGMCVAKEGGTEVLWLAHARRHEVIKCTLDGEVKLTIPWPEASKRYANADEYVPTAVAIGPAGQVFVADGYGRSWVHEFDARGAYVKTFGGPGKQPGQFVCPHGLGVDERGKEPLLVVCDRENNRLQRFDMQGRLFDVIGGDLRRPCTVQQRGDDLLVADLAGRVTILGKDNQVIAHLCDQPDPNKRAQNGIPREQWMEGEFISPHCARWDAKGNLYVMDWLQQGRLTRLERVASR